MKRTFLLSLFIIPLLFACQNHVEYDTKEKNTGKNSDTNSFYTTTSDASKICFYLQNKDGDPEISTFIHDTSADTEQRIPKGTSLSQLALKSYSGFTYYTAVQVEESLNIYYKRNFVTYQFYTSKENGSHLYNLSGLYDTKIQNPSYSTDSEYFLYWEDSDGNHLGDTFTEADKIFYAKMLTKSLAIGTKPAADTKGDILLDDGSVISYSEFAALSDKSKIINHAYAVLVCTNYDSNFYTSAKPGDTFFSTLETEKASLFNGRQKLIAAVYKDNEKYKKIPWIGNKETYLSYPMNLNNYIDGSVNTDYINSLYGNDGYYLTNYNAFSSSISYGKNFCSNTAYADNWYLPSLAELYALYLLVTDSNYSALLTNFYPNFNAGLFWSSNATPPDTYSYGVFDANTMVWTRYTQKAWIAIIRFAGDPIFTSDFSRDYTEVESLENSSSHAIPFRKIN